MEKKFNFLELHAIIATLRSDHGCPWDRKQTHESLKSNTLEEAYEVNQAVSDLSATGNSDNLCEELGDLLLQVMLHSQIAEDNGEFTLEDVIDGVARKMIRRHPHVFGGEHYENEEERKAAWEEIKSGEKGHKHDSPLDEIREVPAAFPALLRSTKVLKKAYKHDVIPSEDEKIFEEMLTSVISLQMAAAIAEDADVMEKRMGEALFAISKLAAKYSIESEMALARETEHFIGQL